VRTASSILGLASGLIGIYHGYNEFLQGATPTGSIFINAVGPPCQGNCFPALTIIPQFEASGILAILVSLVIVVLSTMLSNKRRGLYLIGLSIVQLLVGGGYLPPLLGIIGGVLATRIGSGPGKAEPAQAGPPT
jgi:hypothetical protein